MTEKLLFLDRSAVLACLAEVDPCAVVTGVLQHHAEGHTTLPPEGYLPWTNSEGAYCRSIAMLGAVDTGNGPPVIGVKLINAATSNPTHGRERAVGLGLVFDPETARPRVLAEAGWLSATRTAAYTMVSLRYLGPLRWDAMSLLGCGTLARAHIDLLSGAFPRATRVHLYDTVRPRAAALAEWTRRHHPHLTVRVHDSAQEAVQASSIVVTTTTADCGYLPAAWLAPGTFVAHVSLDDLLPDAFLTAQGLFVDDVDLVSDNPCRILGRMMRDGQVAAHPDVSGSGSGQAVDGTLGQVLTGKRPAIRPTSGHVISNPFGMSVLDVGLLEAVYTVAVDRGLGQVLTLY